MGFVSANKVIFIIMGYRIVKNAIQIVINVLVSNKTNV